MSSKIKQDECSDDAASVCRVCLRGDGRNLTLQEITQDMKTKFKFLMKQTILAKDPYKQVCTICATLLEIFVAFKDVALRANRLMVEGKKLVRFDADDEWPQLAEPLARCKDLVLGHLDALTDSPKQNVELKQEMDTDSEPRRGRSKRLRHKEAAKPPEIEIKLEQIKFDSIPGSDNDDGDNDGDFKPASEDEEPTQEEDDEDFDPKLVRQRKSSAPRDRCHYKAVYKSAPMLCPLCGKNVSAEMAEAHLNQHRGVKPFRCTEPGCGVEFYGDFHRKRHEHRMHNKAGRKSNECHICGKTILGDKGVLNQHVRSIHNTKEKKFTCTICGKGFTLKRYLRQHGMVHSEAFPHACSVCGKRFNNKWSMRTHEKLHQKGSLPAQVAELSSDPVQNIDNVQLEDLVTE